LELQVKKTGKDHWKAKNQNTRYTTFGKTDSPSIEKTGTSQNSYSSKRLSRKERNNALRFPNTVPAQTESLTDKDLRKASSRSIKLSKKCDLSQMKESQMKYEDTLALLPKTETPISSTVNKPVVSLPSQSFYDIVDTVSTVSTPSLTNFKVENKKTFANIVNRAKSISRTSNHSSNSEYEINVLHYENDILSRNNFPQFSQSQLKSTNTNWSSVYNCSSIKIQDDNNNLADERNAAESYTWDEGKIAGDTVKHSWKIDNWMLSSQRKEPDNAREIKIAETSGRSPYDCKIKYSWQVIGTGTQTSYTLLQDLLNNMEDNKSAYKMCSIKYSWQIIGISTQVSLHDHNEPDYWSGMVLTPNKNYNDEVKIGINETDRAKLHDHVRYPEGRLKKYLILNNQQTQTFAEKEIQADPNDCYAKYSWHKLIKQYL